MGLKFDLTCEVSVCQAIHFKMFVYIGKKNVDKQACFHWNVFWPDTQLVFTCGGFSESSAGYLSRRKTLENCKNNRQEAQISGAKLKQSTMNLESHLNCWLVPIQEPKSTVQQEQ